MVLLDCCLGGLLGELTKVSTRALARLYHTLTNKVTKHGWPKCLVSQGKLASGLAMIVRFVEKS